MNSNPMSGPAKGAADTVAFAGKDRPKGHKALPAEDDQGRTFGAAVVEAGKKSAGKAKGLATGIKADAENIAAGGPAVRPEGLQKGERPSLSRPIELPVLRKSMPGEAAAKTDDNSAQVTAVQAGGEDLPVDAKTADMPENQPATKEQVLQEARPIEAAGAETDNPTPAQRAEKLTVEAAVTRPSAAEQAAGAMAVQASPARQHNGRSGEAANQANTNTALASNAGTPERDVQPHVAPRDASARGEQNAGHTGNGKPGPDIFGFAAERQASKFSGTAMPQPAADASPTPSPSTVTVVEARQFVGLSVTQSSAASVVNAIASEGQWGSALRGTESVSATTLNATQNTVNTLKIQLKPAELGAVDATLKLSGGRLVVELNAQTLEAYRHLSDSQQHILKSLKGQGYAVEQISVQHTVQDRGVTQQSSQSAGLGTGDSANQSGQNSSADNGGGSRPGRQEEHAHGDRPAGHEAADDDPHRVVSDAVYL
ncbi:flagellar hook-length control protein FliK [Hoeflea prorocentri]|uniref:Flagellar hook-length control protein FliK n=1 Tax=Hoeflea prorocentri TaxID=1922333 RepID=A0A9X3UJ89_9HYPH|nr:flagellar hook-length control protein FliK [Hoeflea prorocentri]MCY6382383.1 flagellar hook-length control protein FliK [Hoeflea prorocentri]MDA5400183.1 flagellar hook-length control protein FliK [Hoeflea prorocentri]